MFKKIGYYSNVLFKGPKDSSSRVGRESERQRRIALTAITAMIAKVVSMMIPMITIRITLNYLGTETYGLWMTVTTFFSLFAFADLGLGYGLQTRLSRVTGPDSVKESQKLISSGFIMLSGISILLFIIFVLLYPFIQWADLMHAESAKTVELAGKIVFVIVLARILSIPLSLIQRMQLALQEGYNYNLWQCGASILSLVSIYVVTYLNLGQMALITASSMVVIVISLLNYIVYFGKQRQKLRPTIKYFDKVIAQQLLKTGVAFLLLSILTTVGLSIDNFIVARTAGLKTVSTYSILYKVVTMITVANTMLSTPLWSANGEALARGDYHWVKKNTKKMALLSTVLTFITSVVLLIVAGPAFKIWINKAFTFQPGLLIGMLAMQLVYAIIEPYFMVLNGAGIVKKQIYIFCIYTTLSLFLKYYFALKFGAIAIPWVGALCYALLIGPPVLRLASKVYNKSS